MKKCLGLFMLVFVLCISSIDIHAASWKFTWENTTIHIPVGESLENYRYQPKAKLLKDGIVLSDAAITYNTEGDWLYYFKDINPYKIGEYKVWYKAYDSKYSPGTCTGYKSLVSFIIEDKINPTINVISDVVSIHRGSSFDLSNNYVAYDNYKLREVKIIENIDTLTVGSYPVRVVAIDEANNQATADFTVIVYENAKPVISCSLNGDSISIPLKQEEDFSQYFTATDSVDGDISSKIHYPSFSSDTIGTYTYTVSVENAAGLKEEYSIEVEVCDDEAPILELSAHSIMVDYLEDFSSFNFSKYIKKLTDNVEIDEDNLSIEYDIKNEVGSYSVIYSYTDGIYTVSDELIVMLVSHEKPEIEVEDVETTIGNTIDLSDYVYIYDESDPNVLDSLEINDSKVDYEKEGTYYATVYCMNSSGLSSTKRLKVIVRGSSGIISNSSMPLVIVAAAAIVVALGLAGFIVFYFVFKRKMR